MVSDPMTALADPIATKSFVNRDVAPIGMREFAAMSGRTEEQYQKVFFRKLAEGNLTDLLNIQAYADFDAWLENNLGSSFVVMFNLSHNRRRNVVMYCVCSMDFDKDEPKIVVSQMIPGHCDKKPKETKGMDGFEFFICDMNPNVI